MLPGSGADRFLAPRFIKVNFLAFWFLARERVHVVLVIFQKGSNIFVSPMRLARCSKLCMIVREVRKTPIELIFAKVFKSEMTIQERRILVGRPKKTR